MAPPMHPAPCMSTTMLPCMDKVRFYKLFGIKRSADVGAASSYGHSSGYSSSQPYLPSSQGYRADGGISTLPSQSTMSPYGRNGSISSSYSQDSGHLARIGVTGAQPQGMFTRNLIGSLAASAFRLNDTDDHIGVWFILQDLSVRTEGPFR